MSVSPKRSNRGSWLAFSLVGFALWGLQTDYFPFSQSVRPSWYVYGWPICFGTCSRNRFGLTTFSMTAAIIDLVTSLAMLIATHFFLQNGWANGPHRLRCFLATVTGCVSILLVAMGGLQFVLPVFGVDPPRPGVSEVAGDSRPLQRLLSPLVFPGIVLGVFACGYTFFLIVANRFAQAHPTATKMHEAD